eukprot:SAG25_NODE_7986_length_447_cov_0.882184_2_plen_22_part_01
MVCAVEDDRWPTPCQLGPRLDC